VFGLDKEVCFVNLFIVFTPYHLMISAVMRSRHKGDVTILIDQYGRLGEYSRCEVWSSFLDGEYYYVASKGGGIVARLFDLNFLLSMICSGPYRLTLNKIVKRSFEHTYIFNDSNPNGQYFLKGISTESVFYVEDGSAPYNSHRLKNGNLARIFDAFRYGLYFDRVERLGESKYLDGHICSFSHLAASSFKARVPIFQLELADTWRDIMVGFSESSECDLGFLADDSNKFALVLLPSGFGNAQHGVRALAFKGEIERLIAKEYIVLVKAHPLDRLSDEMFAGCQVTVVPSYISSEILGVCCRNLDVVIGDYTTSLLSFRFFFPGKAVISIDWDVEGHDLRLVGVFKKAGIVVKG
jgi:hypothetical protein